jgi:hypothetical protein
MELWLIRTQENQIVGPFSRDRVLEIIQTGTLTFRDELCRANEEWFFLNETDEVRQRLGRDVPEMLRAALRKNAKTGPKGAADSLTEEPTEEVQSWRDDITEPGLDVDRNRLGELASSNSALNPWFQEGTGGGGSVDSTRVLKSGSSTADAMPREQNPASARFQSEGLKRPQPPKVEVAGSSVSENSIFRALGLTLALFALVIIYWVFRILRS